MPMVTWMSNGRTVTLSRANQETVALWGAKTILMLEAIREPERVQLDAFRLMYETRLPSADIAIAMREAEGRWPYRFAARGSAAELCVGHLVIRANAHGSAAVRIWPAEGSVRFPPVQLVRAA